MRLFWLVHHLDGSRAVFIQEGRDLLHARLLASMAGFEGEFAEAHELDASTAGKVPRRAIGRVLLADEAAAVLAKLTPKTQKRPRRPSD